MEEISLAQFRAFILTYSRSQFYHLAIFDLFKNLYLEKIRKILFFIAKIKNQTQIGGYLYFERLLFSCQQDSLLLNPVDLVSFLKLVKRQNGQLIALTNLIGDLRYILRSLILQRFSEDINKSIYDQRSFLQEYHFTHLENLIRQN